VLQNADGRWLIAELAISHDLTYALPGGWSRWPSGYSCGRIRDQPPGLTLV